MGEMGAFSAIFLGKWDISCCFIRGKNFFFETETKQYACVRNSEGGRDAGDGVEESKTGEIMRL